MVAQAIVDCNKKFTDMFVGMLGSSVNDSCILRLFGLYRKATLEGLFDVNMGVPCMDGYTPYLSFAFSPFVFATFINGIPMTLVSSEIAILPCQLEFDSIFYFSY